MARSCSSSDEGGTRCARALGALTALLTLASPARSLAQDEGGGGARDRRVTTTVIMMTDGRASAAQATSLTIGLRRGIRDVRGVRYVDPVDVLSARDIPEQVQMALDDLDAIADMVRTGDPAEAARRADAAIQAFESNLLVVRRASLTDAYMLLALSRCRMRERRECAEGIERVVAFREGIEYDVRRYPEEYLQFFEDAKERALGGQRGSIEVTTEPEGAEVFIDGRSYGPSPAVAEGLLVGDHYVTLKQLGYEKLIERASVSNEQQNSAHYDLVQSDRALLLDRAMPRMRGELGERRAGPYTTGMASYLFVNQAIVGVVRPGPAGQVDVSLYLYDLRTRFLLARKDATLPGNPQDEGARESAAELASQIYHGVDLSGAIAAPEDAPIVGPARPLYERWWFWTAVGVVVVSGVVAVALLAGGSEQTVPEGWTRFDGQIR